MQPLLQWRASSMQCACAVLSSVVCLAVQYFSSLSHKWHDFQKNKMCWFSLQLWNISHSKKNRVRYSQKCVLVFMWFAYYSCQILMKLEFSGQIFEEYSNIKFHEKSIHWEPSCSMWMDRWTDMTKLILDFRNLRMCLKTVSTGILFLLFSTIDLICDKFLFHNLCYYIFKFSYNVVWYWMSMKAAVSGWRTGITVSNEFICFEAIVTFYSKTIRKCRLNWQGNCTSSGNLS